MERHSDSRAGDAFRRLLAEASANELARVDALVAFSQRTVFVATWEPASTTWRTLEHEDGHSALPVFSDEWELDQAAAELEWSREGFRVGRREVGAREAMRHVLNEQLAYLVIDLASPHCVEASRAEVEPLARAGSRSDSTGPFAGVGRITSTMIEAVRTSQVPSASGLLSAPNEGRASSHPPPLSAQTPTLRPSSERSLPAVRERSEPSLPAVEPEPTREAFVPPAVGLGSFEDTNASLVPVTADPPDAWLDAFGATLKEFPEVEWASYCLVSIAGEAATPRIALRVDPSFRQRMPEIVASLGEVSRTLQAPIGVLLLDRASLVREARSEGLPFHPWRRRKTGSFTPIQ